MSESVNASVAYTRSCWVCSLSPLAQSMVTVEGV